jgi:hypothetical protein
VAAQFVEHDDLVGMDAGEPVRGQAPDPLDQPGLGGVAQRVMPGSVQPGPGGPSSQNWVLLLCVGAVLLVISAGALINYMFSKSGRQNKSLHVLRVVNAAVVRIEQAF